MSIFSSIRTIKNLIIGNSGSDYSFQPDDVNAQEGSVLQYNASEKQYKHQILTFSGLPNPDALLLSKTDSQIINSVTISGGVLVSNAIYVQWDNIDFQNGGITRTGVNNDEIQVSSAGVYLFNYEIAFNETATSSTNGQRITYLVINKNIGNANRRYARMRVAVNFAPSILNPISYKTEMNGSALINLNAGDVVSLVAVMESGTLLSPETITVGNDAGPGVQALYNEFSCVRIL